MAENPRICTDVSLDFEEQMKAGALALAERFDNSPDPVALSDLSAHILQPEAAVLLTGKRWKPGRTITISFLDGAIPLQAKVRAYANLWLDSANLKFRWLGMGSGGEIRITFTRGGSWSYLGTDNLAIPKPRPTMQFGWLDANSNEEEIRRVVLHEFGHMLGLGHEQGHPEGGIPWNKAKVYDYYRRTNGWNESEVNSQVFQRYAKSQTQFSTYDRLSIMHYAIPAELLTDPRKAVGFNTRRSKTDMAFVRSIYPKPEPPKPPEPPNPGNPAKSDRLFARFLDRDEEAA